MALSSSALTLRRLLARFESNRIILLSPKRALSGGMSGVAAENRGKTGKIRADDGVELYYEQRGDGPRAILCIPGALGSVGTDFPPQTDHFGREGSGFTIVGFDPRGYGKSRPHSRDFSGPGFYQRDAMDGAGVMEKLGFQKFSVLYRLERRRCQRNNIGRTVPRTGSKISCLGFQRQCYQIRHRASGKDERYKQMEPQNERSYGNALRRGFPWNVEELDGRVFRGVL